MAKKIDLEFYKDILPTKDELKRFGLNFMAPGTDDEETYWYPIYIGHSEVWAMAIKPDSPIYAIYDCGTNCLKILRKIGNGPWVKIEPAEIDNLYGLLWRFTTESHRLQWVNKDYEVSFR